MILFDFFQLTIYIKGKINRKVTMRDEPRELIGEGEMGENKKGWFICLLGIVLVAVVMGCEKSAETPPPAHVLSIMQHVKSGYNNGDVELLTADFADTMFSKGFTKSVWLDTMGGIKKKLGNWKSEVYLGNRKNVYTWRATFEKGRVKCVIVLDEEEKVSGLWFR